MVHTEQHFYGAVGNIHGINTQVEDNLCFVVLEIRPVYFHEVYE